MTTLVEPASGPTVTRWMAIGRRHVIEWLALVSAPAIMFFVLQVRPMAITDVIDASFYTAYSQHGGDLITRFGSGRYYWVRLGFILPARLCYLIAGSLGGFYLFRYLLALLAIVPAYLLVRRTRNRTAGWIVVAAILTCPVAYATWGSDYPDSAAFSYLVGGAALLAMPSEKRANRIALRTAAGALLTLAVHCQVVALPLVLAIVAGYLVAYLRRDRVKQVMIDMGILLGSAAVVTGMLCAIAYLWLGHADIFTPTVKAYEHLQTPRQLKLWHSTNWHWVLTVPYVLVPFAVCTGWLLSRTRGRSLDRAEISLGVGTSLAVLAFTWMQFFGTVGSLEYHIYSSMLWGLTCVVVGLVAAEVLRPVLDSGWGKAAALAAVTLPALAWSVATPVVRFEQFRWPVAVAVAMVALVVIGTWVRVSVVVIAAAVGIALTNLVLTTAAVTKPPLPGLATVPHGQYSRTLGNPVAPEVNEYAVASKLAGVVGPAQHPGDKPVSWWPKGAPHNAVNVLSAQYLWLRLPSGIPSDTRGFAGMLQSADPRPLLLLGGTDRQFEAFLGVVSKVGVRYQVLRRTTLRHGDLSVAVWVVELDSFPAPAAG